VFIGGGLLGFAVLALWVFCIFDVVATDDALVRSPPKVVWLLIVIFVPTIGSIAWLLLGRPGRGSLPAALLIVPNLVALVWIARHHVHTGHRPR
jgi:phospholipase D-like protein